MNDLEVGLAIRQRDVEEPRVLGWIRPVRQHDPRG